MMARNQWSLDMGAQWLPNEGVRFRVWAPAATQVEVEIVRDGTTNYHALNWEGDNTYSAMVPLARPGTRYKFRLDGKESYPDPYSRKQPEGVHGASEVVDPASFVWHDEGWSGTTSEQLVIYECHVGTYTQDGTFDALIPELGELQRLGVTALELMPVAEFPGRWNWGYDGVDLFAPSMTYGGPEALKALVDAAHHAGLAILLDVVYNHLGPSGNYLRAFAPQYFTDRYQTPWGEALNYDGEGSRWVRHFVVENACYWVNEYHFDGLRLDATHAIFDASPKHVLQEIGEQVRASVQGGRDVVVIAEEGSNDVSLVRPVPSGGKGLDAVWSDDFHHAMRTFLTGERDGYFADYDGRLASVAKVMREGFLYQGEISSYLGHRRGAPVGSESASRFVFCLQNHDQVGNRAFGDRLNHKIDPGDYLAASALLLLAPETPLIFMGQEFAASAAFCYFTDHEPALGQLVTAGRRKEFSRFAAFADTARREQIPDPQAEGTFLSSKLNLGERFAHRDVYRCYHDLLQLRRVDPVFRRRDRGKMRATVIGGRLLALRRWHDHVHRLLLANFGTDTDVPLDQFDVGNMPVTNWDVMWVSVGQCYSGGLLCQPSLSPILDAVSRIIGVPAHSAVLLGA